MAVYILNILERKHAEEINWSYQEYRELKEETSSSQAKNWNVYAWRLNSEKHYCIILIILITNVVIMSWQTMFIFCYYASNGHYFSNYAS